MYITGGPILIQVSTRTSTVRSGHALLWTRRPLISHLVSRSSRYRENHFHAEQDDVIVEMFVDTLCSSLYIPSVRLFMPDIQDQPTVSARQRHDRGKIILSRFCKKLRLDRSKICLTVLVPYLVNTKPRTCFISIHLAPYLRSKLLAPPCRIGCGLDMDRSFPGHGNVPL